MIEVNKEYLGQAIIDLHKLLGVKDDIPYEALAGPFRKGDIQACVSSIADYLGLPIKVDLSYVASGYSPAHSPSQHFETEALSVTDRTGRSAEAITAQVGIPPNLPMCGTRGLVDFPIHVKVSHDIAEFPSTFYAIMAHELSHIVLHSLQHGQKDNEIYTDITAMLLGFCEVLQIGRKTVKDRHQWSLFETTTVTETTTYGYLSDENFDYAYNKVIRIRNDSMQAKETFKRKMDLLKKRIESLRKNVVRIRKYMESVDNNHKSGITAEDAQKIVAFHQHGYVEEFERFLSEIEQDYQEKQKHNSMDLFLYRFFEDLNKNLENVTSNIKGKNKLLHNDLKVLKRNVSFWARLRNELGFLG